MFTTWLIRRQTTIGENPLCSDCILICQ